MEKIDVEWYTKEGFRASVGLNFEKDAKWKCLKREEVENREELDPCLSGGKHRLVFSDKYGFVGAMMHKMYLEARGVILRKPTLFYSNFH